LILQLGPRTLVAVESLRFPCGIRSGHGLSRTNAGACSRRDIELRAMRAGTALDSEFLCGVAGRRHIVGQ
jgi:hypothetical protein